MLGEVEQANSSIKTFERLAMKLFSVPKTETSFLLSLTAALLLQFLTSKAIFFWLVSTTSLFAATRFLSLKFNTRRIFFLSAILTFLSSLSYLLFKSLAGSFFIYLSVLYFCSDSDFVRISAYSMAVYLVLEVFNSVSLFSMLPYAISIATFGVYLKSLDRDVGRFNIRKFVKAFVLFWLTSSPQYLEKPLGEISETKSGTVRCLKIGRVKLISTSFHPGPFRNVGGARMVEEIRRRGCIYLHSPTTHVMNPVDGMEVEKIVNAIERLEFERVTPRKPVKVEGEKYEVFLLPFSNLKVFFVSGKERIDDFKVKCNSFVVDCHNAHLPGYDMELEDVGEIEELIRKAEKVESIQADLSICSFRLEFESESIRGVDVLAMDYGDVRIALIVFDSNNVNLRFRKEVERRVEELGFKPIIASTDNHSRTGIRVKFSYRAAGDDGEDWKVIDKIIEGLVKCTFENAECEYGERSVEIKVMGEGFFRDSERAAQLYAGKYIAAYISLIALNFLTPLLSKLPKF